MRRRDFISRIVGSAALWPLAARAQQPASDEARRCAHAIRGGRCGRSGSPRGISQGPAANGLDPRTKCPHRHIAGATASPTPCAICGRMVALTPDVILASPALTLAPLLHNPHVPIVFAGHRSGCRWLRRELARPGGNATGFTSSNTASAENGWNCSRRSRPRMTRAAVLRDPRIAAGIGQFGAVQAWRHRSAWRWPPSTCATPATSSAPSRRSRGSPNGGLVVFGSPGATIHRDLIITLAARHRLPAVYSARYFVAAGGLISYGPDSSTSTAARRLRRPHPQGREARRPSGAVTDQVRTGDQPEDRQGARPRNSADIARPRRRGDRISQRRYCICSRPLLARSGPSAMSAIRSLSGVKRTCAGQSRL